MTEDQKNEFQQRRLTVQRRHIANDPKLRARRRKRNRTMLVSVLGGIAAFAIGMVLVKSFVLAVHGPRDFARIVAPILENKSDGSLPVRLFGPDPVSREIASLLQPMLPQSTFVATTGQVADDLPKPDAGIGQAPES